MPSDSIIGPVSSYYVSQRLKLHFADWGNEDKPPLLLVHGGRDHARNWDAVARELRDEYHVIAVDLRGHGDSQWATGGHYVLPEFVLDVAQLIDVLGLAPLRIVSHSMGAAISLFYTGVYPEKVSKLVAIEGMGIPEVIRKRYEGKELWELMSEWVDSTRETSRRLPRRYPTINAAAARMQEENPHLSPEQARHLTVHGVARNEDGSFTWKFDNASRPLFPIRMKSDEMEKLWARIECPTLLVHGTESHHGDPREDGRSDRIPGAEVLAIEGAGHWVHHDQLDVFLGAVREFLRDGPGA